MPARTRRSVQRSRVRAGRLPRQPQADAEPRGALGFYPPWTEIKDRQSISTSRPAVRGGIRGRGHRRRQVGRNLQTYSKRDIGPRFGFAYDVNGSGKTLVRGGFGVFWNLSRAAPRRPSPNQPFLQSTSLNANPTSYGSNCCSRTVCRTRRASIQNSRPPAPHDRSSTSASAMPSRASGTSISSGVSGRTI